MIFLGNDLFLDWALRGEEGSERVRSAGETEEKSGEKLEVKLDREFGSECEGEWWLKGKEEGGIAGKDDGKGDRKGEGEGDADEEGEGAGGDKDKVLARFLKLEEDATGEEDRAKVLARFLKLGREEELWREFEGDGDEEFSKNWLRFWPEPEADKE